MGFGISLRRELLFIMGGREDKQIIHATCRTDRRLVMETAATPYNPFDYLETQEEIDTYLADAFLDEEPRVFLIALGFLAQKRGMTEVAKRAGVNRESLH